jgi:hypothetical protein
MAVIEVGDVPLHHASIDVLPVAIRVARAQILFN